MLAFVGSDRVDVPRRCAEHSIIAPISAGISADELSHERMLVYGEVVELRFIESGVMLGVHPGFKGLAYASHPRTPARAAHDLRFHAPGLPKGGAGLPVCYGDELVIKCRGDNGSWHRLGVTAVRDLDAKMRALSSLTEAAVACVQWGERRTTDCQSFRLEGFCDLRGVPLRVGDRFYLRFLGSIRDGAPHGCHLHADPEASDADRQVGARWLRRETMQELEAFKVGPMRSCSALAGR